MGKNRALPGMIILVSALMGLLIAAIEQMAFDNEYILHLYIESAEVPGLQILTIVLFMISGSIFAALKS